MSADGNRISGLAYSGETIAASQSVRAVQDRNGSCVTSRREYRRCATVREMKEGLRVRHTAGGCGGPLKRRKDAMSRTKAAVVFQQSPSSKSLLDVKEIPANGSSN